MDVKRIAEKLEVSEKELLIQPNAFDNWNFTPWSDTCHGSMGSEEQSRCVYLLTLDGEWLVVPGDYESKSNYAYEGTHSGDGMSVAELLSAKGISSSEIDAVIVDRIDFRDWEGQDVTDEREVRVYPVRPIDTGKIRRRVEDALRKTNNESTILSLAVRLGVKID
jgi:hypothetical protein